MNDHLTNISVKLAGRTYPVLASFDEAETIQQINNQLNNEFSKLQKQYANKLNKQDILAMLLFTYAKNLHEEQQKNSSNEVEERINSIENILEQAFEHE